MKTLKQVLIVSSILLGSLYTMAFAATVSYSYDALGRVTLAVYSNGITIAYSYDNAGNRTVRIVTGA